MKYIAAYLGKLFFGIRVTKLYIWNVGNTAGQRGMYSFFEKLNIFFRNMVQSPFFSKMHIRRMQQTYEE